MADRLALTGFALFFCACSSSATVTSDGGVADSGSEGGGHSHRVEAAALLDVNAGHVPVAIVATPRRVRRR
jgi:hypothetical protein